MSSDSSAPVRPLPVDGWPALNIASGAEVENEVQKQKNYITLGLPNAFSCPLRPIVPGKKKDATTDQTL